MLLLSAEAAFKTGGPFFGEFTSENLSQGFILGRPSLRTKDVDIPYFVQNFLLALLAYMESAATHLTLTFMSFCCMRIQSFRRIPSLKALNERCSMNDMPSICMLLTFAPNSTDFVFLASYNGTYIMTVNADDAVPDLLPYKHFLFLYKNLSDDGKTFLVILGIWSKVPYSR